MLNSADGIPGASGAIDEALRHCHVWMAPFVQGCSQCSEPRSGAGLSTGCAPASTGVAARRGKESLALAAALNTAGPGTKRLVRVRAPPFGMDR